MKTTAPLQTLTLEQAQKVIAAALAHSAHAGYQPMAVAEDEQICIAGVTACGLTYQ